MPGTSKPSTVSQLVSCKVSLLGLSVSSKKLGLQGSPGRSPGQDLKMAWCKTYAVTSARQHSPHWLKRYAVRRAGCVAQGYMAAMDLGLEARYKDVRTS